jgi:drug/metabolite transporter (DMT)-like permease
MSRRGAALFLTLSLIWGLPYLLIRVAVREVDPATLVFLRTAPAAIILIPLAVRSGALRGLRGKWHWLALYSVVEFGVPWLLMSNAEQHLTSSLTGMLVATVPLIAAVAARFTHPDEQFGASRVTGLLLGALGVALLVGFDVAGSNWVWILAMLVVAVGYTFGPIIISLRLQGTQGIAVVASSIALVALLYTPYGATHLPAHLSATAAWAIVGLVGITAVGFLVFFELIKEIGPSRTVVVTYLNTAVAVVLGVVALNEPLTTGLLVGFPLIIAGSVLATRRPAAAEVSEVSPTPPSRLPRSWRRARSSAPNR